MFQPKREKILRSIAKSGFGGPINLLKMKFGSTKLRKPNYQPAEVQLEPTTNCNLRCRMCNHTFLKNPAGNLDTGIVENLLGSNKTIQDITFVGNGEPLLNPRFLEMLEIAKEKGCWVGFADNFTLLDREVAERVVELQVDWVAASIDGATKETYEKIRVGGDFGRVTMNIKTLAMLKKKTGSEKPRLFLGCVPQRDNLRELPQMARLAKQLGVNEIHFSNLMAYGETNDLLPQTRQAEAEKILQRVREEAGREGVALITQPRVSGTSPKKSRLCGYPWKRPFITAAGLVLPCPLISHEISNKKTLFERFVMGNLREETFREIWTGEKFARFRGGLLDGRLPEACINCRGC